MFVWRGDGCVVMACMGTMCACACVVIVAMGAWALGAHGCVVMECMCRMCVCCDGGHGPRVHICVWCGDGYVMMVCMGTMRVHVL